MQAPAFALRAAAADDALTIAALATQVFLDTYATDGVFHELAIEAQGKGIGKALIDAAERLAAAQALRALWLTAWERNERALAFYARLGYADLGGGTYTFRDQTYGTRVLAKLW
jgi:GNAT superfamily N-acetyltransferase